MPTRSSRRCCARAAPGAALPDCEAASGVDRVADPFGQPSGARVGTRQRGLRVDCGACVFVRAPAARGHMYVPHMVKSSCAGYKAR